MDGVKAGVKVFDEVTEEAGCPRGGSVIVCIICGGYGCGCFEVGVGGYCGA